MSEMSAGAVTLADLFRVMSAMQADVAKVATRLEVIDNRNRTVDEHLSDHETRVRKLEDLAVDPADIRDHETRLRGLEAFRWKLVGVAVAVGAMSGALAAVIIWALGRH